MPVTYSGIELRTACLCFSQVAGALALPLGPTALRWTALHSCTASLLCKSQTHALSCAALHCAGGHGIRSAMCQQLLQLSHSSLTHPNTRTHAPPTRSAIHKLDALVGDFCLHTPLCALALSLIHSFTLSLNEFLRSATSAPQCTRSLGHPATSPPSVPLSPHSLVRQPPPLPLQHSISEI